MPVLDTYATHSHVQLHADDGCRPHADLLTNQRALGRPQDMPDVESLEPVSPA